MDLMIDVTSDSGVPLHKQLYVGLRGAILAGRICPGQRLPSTRELARMLGVSRTTVTQSYDELYGEGYLEARIGSGTFVCQQLPEDLLRPHPVQPAPERAGPELGGWAVLSAFGMGIKSEPEVRISAPDVPVSFAAGLPDLGVFPVRQWGRILSRHARLGRLEMLAYSDDAKGYLPLREAIASYLARSRAVRCTAYQLLIVTGFQQGLDLVCRIALDRGDTVAIEDPGYLGARSVFAAYGGRILPVPVDEAGIRTEALPKKGRVKLIYITPSHQFPTGARLPLGRRLELLAWAEKNGALVVEDDYDSEYRYEGRPVPALQGLDRAGSVIYIGTFSKVLYPGLRIGYMVAPARLAPLLATAKLLADRQSPVLAQLVLTDFIGSGLLERHIRRMRLLYGCRRQTLVDAMTRCFGDRIRICGENAGMQLMARFNLELSDSEIELRGQRVGIALRSVAGCYLGEPPGSEFLFGYASVPESVIGVAIKKLSKSLQGS